MKTTITNTKISRLFFAKICLVLISLVAGLSSVKAINYLPSYGFNAAITTYTPITTGTVIATGNIDDNAYTGYNIGFPFVYNGNTYTNFSVNSNGLLAFGGTIINYYNQMYNNNNVIAAMNADLQGQSNGEMRFDTIGTAPFRKLVVQFSNWSFYPNASNNDSLNFQIILSESTNNIQFHYNVTYFAGSSQYVEVGMMGGNSLEFLKRTTSTDWSTTTQALNNYDQCYMDGTTPVLPFMGLRYTYTAPALSYNTSEVITASALGASPGSSDQAIVKVRVVVDGFGGTAAATQLNVLTNGTTNLSDIANLEVYYTGASNVFSNITQFGSTVSSPSAVNLVTDSLNLSYGDNYFWIVYDVAPLATLSNVLDAEVSFIRVAGVNQVPTVTAPAGNRIIAGPMSYLGSSASHSNTGSVGRGTNNNEALRMMVITSSVGAPIDLTQLNLSANGTTDTSNIRNMKVWYTGNSSTFATTTQFGTTLAILPGTLTFNVTGLQSLVNDTNYFWLTYDIDPLSTIGNFIDGEFLGATVDAIVQTPGTTAPVGNRIIRDNYCMPVESQSAYSCGAGSPYYSITNVSSTGGSTNISNFASGCGLTNAVAGYTYFNGMILTAAQNSTVNITVANPNNTMGYAIWIDYNQDGVFDNSTERVAESTNNNGVYSFTGNVTIPCSALLGATRMRIRQGATWYFGLAAPSSPCTDIGYGETEDYDVVITPNPISYSGTLAFQEIGSAFGGATDKAILRVPVKTIGCGVGVINTFVFSTAGSTNASDIANAKLYRTGSSTMFSNTNLLGTVASPSGQFSFSVADTLLANDTTNYWLAYDISGGATISNVVDARLDSIFALGAYRIPTISNPAGNIVIAAAMAFNSAEATQNNIAKVARGTANNEILGLRVVMSSTGAPVNLTQLDFSANGTTDTAEISNIKVWYTGSSSTFGMSTQFGSTLSALPGTVAFNVAGLQPLLNDTNYFWLTYDVNGAAVLGNFIDAECSSATINGNTQSPTPSAPAGNRMIREQYCTPLLAYGNSSCSWSILDVVTTTGAVVNINNSGSGALCANINNYIYYNTSNQLTVNKSQTFGINLQSYGGSGGYTVWIDYNQDGIFNNTNERVFRQSLTAPSSSESGSITIPCSASTGLTRMRIREGYWYWNSAPPSDPCSDNSGYGETEDYDVLILDLPVAYASSDAIQSGGTTPPSTSNLPILRVPVQANGCGVAIVNDFKFSTLGSTSASDIVTANLYKTGTSNVFSTTNLVATVSSPSGSFSFAVVDTLVNNVTNNYWLSYDISGSATLGNTIDARFDSIQVLGNYYIPDTSNPAGNYTITAPMTHLGSDASQNVLQSIGRGTSDNQILGLRVIMSSIGAPIFATQLDFNTVGTTDTSNIRNIKVWYTGASSTFATGNQFGSTLAYLPGTTTFSVTSNLPLLNDTNYFWLTYNVDVLSTIGNFVDAECLAITIAGTPITPATTAPVGARQIREDYCLPIQSQATYSCGGGITFYAITNVSTTGGSTNISNMGSVCGATNLTAGYTYFNGMVLTATQNSTVDITAANPNNTMGYTIWIDYNQDGVFNNTNERVGASTAPNGVNSYTATVNIPCAALPGATRMRVRQGATWYFGLPAPASPCTDIGYGETEDYDVMIIANPVSFGATTAFQNTTSTSASATNKPILRVPVKTIGCGNGVITNMHFTTAGTTTVTDITAAKLYRTGASAVFNTSTLLGNVSAPSGGFNFSFTDTLISNDTTNYWLTYDISGGAATSNVVDATYDSAEVIGAYYTPIVSNPAGNVTIILPMTFLSSTITQNAVSKIGKGTADNQIIAARVIMSSSGAPLDVTQLDFNATGSSDTANIRDIKVWFTGNSSSFATGNQFGSTLSYLPGTINFSVMGQQSLMPDTNYFWLSYSIDGASLVGNIVDGECTSIVISGTPQTPSTTAPAGSREIRANYCSPTHNNQYACIAGVAFNSISDLAANCAPSPNYTLYPSSGATTTTVLRSGTYNLAVTTDGYASGSSISAWFDWNNNGTLETTEWYDLIRVTTLSNQTVTLPITIPNSASLGTIRMRIRTRYSTLNAAGDACTTFGSGSGRDYDINIDPAPPQTTYTWNQVTPADFTVGSNWTPTRTAPFANDVLVFNAGGSVVANNVPTESIAKLLIQNSTTVTMNSSSAVTYTVIDTLDVSAGSIVSSNVNFTIGSDTTLVGSILGAGKIAGDIAIRRWVNATTTSYDFPLANGVNNRSANLTFTTPPVGGSITCKFIATNPGNAGLPLTEGLINVNTASIYGFWRFTSANGFTGGTFTQTINAEGFAGVTFYGDLVLVRRINNIATWSLLGTHLTTTGSNSAPVLSRSGVNALGEFAVAGDIAVNPLPVKLITFKANSLKGDVLLNWSTASELNNKGFEVQRSVDGKTFTKVGFVNGKGTSNVLVNYTLTDSKAFVNAKTTSLYYRLRQVDLDGAESFSNIVNVIDNNKTLSGVAVYPNPFNSSISVDLVSVTASAYTVSIVDIQGRVIFTKDVNVTEGLNTLTLDQLSELNQGIYFLRINGQESTTIKLVKTN